MEAYSSEVQSIIIMMESMVACNRHGASYILIRRQQEVNDDTVSNLSIVYFHVHLTMAHFLQQGHTYSNKVTSSVSVTPFGSHFFFKPPQEA